MIDALVRLAGSLIVGGIGLLLILIATALGAILVREIVTHLRERN